MDSLKIKVKKLHKDAKIPDKAHDTDACYDLYTARDTRVPSSGGRAWVGTGIALGLPKGFGAKVTGRSGYSYNNQCLIGAGEIDPDYIGEIKVLVFNFSAYPLTIVKGSKFAQMKIQKVFRTEILEVKELEDTERGESGFNSSGD